MSLESLGTTYSMAQETRWVDDDTFAIGRWDGTLTLFGLPAGQGKGPKIESAAVSPAWAGLEMITPLSHAAFATSNDAGSIVVWDLSARGLAQPHAVLAYEPSCGVANSGAVVRDGTGQWLVTGHESGRLVIWDADESLRRFQLRTVIDIRSHDPVPSPYRLWNVRAVVPWRNSIVLTGAEDGDLCLVHIPTGEVTCRLRYSDTAQRGINDIALLGDIALAGSCSVGPSDSNAWTYRIYTADRIGRLSQVNLVEDATRAQVFNFSVELVESPGGLLFACATEEGLLWLGEVTENALVPSARTAVSSRLGAAISLRPRSDRLAVVGDNIHLFRVSHDAIA